MNSLQSSARISTSTQKAVFSLNLLNNIMWNNLIIEKRISVNWLYSLLEKTHLSDVWMVFTHPVE